MTIAPERSTRAWPLVGEPPYEGSRIPARVPTILDVPPALRDVDDVLQVNFGPNHPSTHGVLRLIVDLDGEQVVGLSAVIGYLHTGFEKNMEQKTWWKAITYPVARRLRQLPEQRARLRARDREAARARGAGEGHVDADAALRAEPASTRISSTSARPRSSSVRSRCSGTASASARRSSTCSRWSAAAHAHPLLPGGRARRGHPGRLLPRVPRVRRLDAAGARRLPRAARPQPDLARADEGRRPALRRGRDRPRAVRPRPARVRRRLGSPPRLAVSRVRPGRLPRAGVHRRRRLRPLPRPHGRDGRVDEDRPPVPRQARADGGAAVDRGRPQGRAAAARGAPDLDGVAHPPLQDRHGGLPGARGRGVRRDRVAARRIGRLRRLGRRPEAVAGALPRARRSPRSRRRRRARTTR